MNTSRRRYARAFRLPPEPDQGRDMPSEGRLSSDLSAVISFVFSDAGELEEAFDLFGSGFASQVDWVRKLRGVFLVRNAVPPVKPFGAADAIEHDWLLDARSAAAGLLFESAGVEVFADGERVEVRSLPAAEVLTLVAGSQPAVEDMRDGILLRTDVEAAFEASFANATPFADRFGQAFAPIDAIVVRATLARSASAGAEDLGQVMALRTNRAGRPRARLAQWSDRWPVEAFDVLAEVTNLLAERVARAEIPPVVSALREGRSEARVRMAEIIRSRDAVQSMIEALSLFHEGDEDDAPLKAVIQLDHAAEELRHEVSRLPEDPVLTAATADLDAPWWVP